MSSGRRGHICLACRRHCDSRRRAAKGRNFHAESTAGCDPGAAERCFGRAGWAAATSVFAGALITGWDSHRIAGTVRSRRFRIRKSGRFLSGSPYDGHCDRPTSDTLADRRWNVGFKLVFFLCFLSLSVARLELAVMRAMATATTVGRWGCPVIAASDACLGGPVCPYGLIPYLIVDDCGDSLE